MISVCKGILHANIDGKIIKTYFVNDREVTEKEFYNNANKKRLFIDQVKDGIEKIRLINEAISKMGNYCSDNLKEEKESNEMRKTNLNVYEVRQYLKNAPRAKATAIIVGDEIIVKLNEEENLIYIDDGLTWEEWNYFLSDFDDEDVLNATFDIVEELKEEWIECKNVEEAIELFQNHYNIRSLMNESVVNKYIYPNMNSTDLHIDIIKKCKWQYLKK